MAEPSFMWRGSGFQHVNFGEHVQITASANQIRLLERPNTLIANNDGWHTVSNATFIIAKMLSGDTPLLKKYCQLK